MIPPLCILGGPAYPLRAEVLACSLRSWLRGVDVVLVSGLYKTGTSLAVDLCERLGFNDPSTLTNPNERGYGTSVRRYRTRECLELRRLNESLLTRRYGLITGVGSCRARGRGSASVRRSFEAPERYLSAWQSPIVLKDPRFVFTLPHWLEAAAGLRLCMGVLFTYRSHGSLLVAWDAAPVTRELLTRGRLPVYAASCAEQRARCNRMGLSAAVLSLHELRLLDAALASRGPAMAAPPLRDRAALVLP